jgi:hypothetical protein
MSTPYDPGRPEDRPGEQSGYPDAPPPPDYSQGPGQTSHQDTPEYGGQGAPGEQGWQQGWQQGADQGWGQPGQPGQQGGDQGWGQPGQPGGDQAWGQQGQPGQQGGQPWQQGQPGQQGGQPWQQGQPGQPGGQPWDQQGQQGQQPYAGGPGGSAPSYGNAPGYENAPAYNPYGSPGFGTPPGGRPTMSAPMEVVRASQLMFLRVAVGIISAIVAFASSDAIKDSIRNNDPTLSEDQVNSAYNVGVGVAVVFGLIFAVLYVLLAIQVRKGKNWARIVTWVLAGLGVLSGLLSLFGNGTGLEKAVDVLLLLIDIGIIVLLSRKPSNEYFTALKAPRY